MDSSSGSRYRERVRQASQQFKPHRLIYERRIAIYAVLAALPGMALGMTLVWIQPWALDAKIALTVFVFFLWFILTVTLLERIVHPLQTLANVVSALREEDYSFRARDASPNDSLGELGLEIDRKSTRLNSSHLVISYAVFCLKKVVD